MAVQCPIVYKKTSYYTISMGVQRKLSLYSVNGETQALQKK